jgi:acylphosphatase
MQKTQKIQKIVNYSGAVQGVGFRFTACRVAGGFDVTGYVRNLPDERVRCVVEGRADEVDAFLAELASQMKGYIHQTTEQTAPPSGQWRQFGLVY